ncbi:MAG: dipeptidase [Anaerolineaceae bacterium]|nr:dipeptidase [Anaerolineaceae bacterium]
MSDARINALQYAHEHRDRFLEDLQEFLKIPSVSTDPAHQSDMILAAEWLVQKLKSMGVQKTQLFPTQKHPIVYGEYMVAGQSAPTVLIYGHYDVQPPDPLDLWKTGPFEPVIKGNELFARGSSDMKGQILATLKAVESIQSAGRFPVNIKFIFEGEEEIGSPNLPDFLEKNSELLTSTVALNPDAGMISPETPTIVYALRGLDYFEIQIRGPEHDLHSGLFGGVIHNPAQVLCDLIAGMHDTHGKITLPGFYDAVRPLEEEERKELSRLPIQEEFYYKQTGVGALWGEEGYSLVERVGARPTLEVNGMLSGFVGEGQKTIIPSSAMAKISTRLVPDQDPTEVHQQLLRYMEEHAPKSVEWSVKLLSSGSAGITDRNQPATQSLVKALETVWGVKPVFKREGGSIPVVTDMQHFLGIDSVLTGFGLPDDNIHSPNEKLHLPTWTKGIDALINFFYNLANN